MPVDPWGGASGGKKMRAKVRIQSAQALRQLAHNYRGGRLVDPGSALAALSAEQWSQLTPTAQSILRLTRVQPTVPGSARYNAGSNTIYLTPYDRWGRTAMHEAVHALGFAYGGGGVGPGFTPSAQQRQEATSYYFGGTSPLAEAWRQLLAGQLAVATGRLRQGTEMLFSGGVVNPREQYAVYGETGPAGVPSNLMQAYPFFGQPTVRPPRPLASFQWAWPHGR